MSRNDRRWLAILAVAFAAGLAMSWQRWANPVIDSGREMNQPLRLLDGERLYADVGHIYAPLSPYLHAAAYRLFGPSLPVLYADGIFSAAIILLLVYRLARRLLDEQAAGVATLTVMFLCAFKPAGNYVFPYAFSALHGALLALVTLDLCAQALLAPSAARFLWAGLAAGAALLAKTEMGVAAVTGGVAAAWLSRRGDAGAAVRRGLAFCAAAALTAGLVYAAIAARVGWRTLAFDNWLLPFHLPAPLAHYNAVISGFDRPLASLARVLLAAVKLALVAAIVGAISYLVAGPPQSIRRARLVLAGAIAVSVALALTSGLDWDRGPFLAMPVLLAALLVWLARTAASDEDRMAILYSAFALVSLARTFLHVRSGGAYGSFLLPVSVIVFVYAWTGPFARALPERAPRRIARRIVLSLLLASAVGTAVVLAYRYRRSNTVPVTTARGTLVASPDTGTAWNEALAFIAARTRPGDFVAVLPEGTSLVFLSGRRNPLREEIVTPGFLDGPGETRAIAALERTDTRLVLLVNRATREFGAEAFGRDYCRRLMQWIDAHYHLCATFGAQDPVLSIGDKPFFVRAYCR
jgi:4-amino-4-deoxy-L-arabinose transferase-like glycosyltransferase